MKHKKIVMILAAATAFLLVAGISYLLGDAHAVQHMSIKHISAGQAATAMKQDDFYGKYRQNTLIVKGYVQTVKQSGRTYTAVFKTDSSFGASCALGTSAQGVRGGQYATLMTEGGPAQRQPNGVLLVGCVAE